MPQRFALMKCTRVRPCLCQHDGAPKPAAALTSSNDHHMYKRSLAWNLEALHWPQTAAIKRRSCKRTGQLRHVNAAALHAVAPPHARAITRAQSCHPEGSSANPRFRIPQLQAPPARTHFIQLINKIFGYFAIPVLGIGLVP